MKPTLHIQDFWDPVTRASQTHLPLKATNTVDMCVRQTCCWWCRPPPPWLQHPRRMGRKRTCNLGSSQTSIRLAESLSGLCESPTCHPMIFLGEIGCKSSSSPHTFNLHFLLRDLSVAPVVLWHRSRQWLHLDPLQGTVPSVGAGDAQI